MVLIFIYVYGGDVSYSHPSSLFPPGGNMTGGNMLGNHDVYHGDNDNALQWWRPGVELSLEWAEDRCCKLIGRFDFDFDFDFDDNDDDDDDDDDDGFCPRIYAISKFNKSPHFGQCGCATVSLLFLWLLKGIVLAMTLTIIMMTTGLEMKRKEAKHSDWNPFIVIGLAGSSISNEMAQIQSIALKYSTERKKKN